MDKATALDKVIKAFAPELVMWQRLALAHEYRELLRRGDESYSFTEYLNESEYGTLSERAFNSLESLHGACPTGECLTCGAFELRKV